MDTYGVPRYKEINPGFFTIVTFPFLFGVMFGDIGHGALLFCFGMYLVLWKDSILGDRTGSLLKSLIPARYLVALMGFFALYAGLIYNDFLSLNLNLFGSCYDINTPTSTDSNVVPAGVSPPSPTASQGPRVDCVYPFGKL